MEKSKFEGKIRNIGGNGHGDGLKSWAVVDSRMEKIGEIRNLIINQEVASSNLAIPT